MLFIPLMTMLTSVIVLVHFAIVEAIHSSFFNTEIPYMILTSFSFVISMIFYTVVASKYKSLNIHSGKYINIMDNMRDCVVFIDGDDRIVAYNKSFSNNMAKPLGIKKKSSLDGFINKIHGVMEKPENLSRVIKIIKGEAEDRNKFKLTLFNPDKKTYIVRMKIINGHGRNKIGRLLIFHEITDYIKLVNDLKIQNKQLSEKHKKITLLNEKLKEFILTSEKSAIVKERNRISRDFYTSLGYALNLQLAYIEVVLTELRENSEDAGRKLEAAIETTGENMRKIRDSLSTVVSEKIYEKDLIDNLKKAVDDFKYLGISIKFTVWGEPRVGYGDYCMNIYKICQELLSNSLRHGKPKKIDIFISFGDTFKMKIKDNGKSCVKMEKHWGLNAVEERIGELQGRINYTFGKDKGFGVYIEVPRKNVESPSNNHSIEDYINAV